MGNDALFVIGLHGSGDTIALFLQDWEVAKGSLELPKSPGHVVPGKETWLARILSASCFAEGEGSEF